MSYHWQQAEGDFPRAHPHQLLAIPGGVISLLPCSLNHNLPILNPSQFIILFSIKPRLLTSAYLGAGFVRPTQNLTYSSWLSVYANLMPPTILLRSRTIFHPFHLSHIPEHSTRPMVGIYLGLTEGTKKRYFLRSGYYSEYLTAVSWATCPSEWSRRPSAPQTFNTSVAEEQRQSENNRCEGEAEVAEKGENWKGVCSSLMCQQEMGTHRKCNSESSAQKLPPFSK